MTDELLFDGSEKQVFSTDNPEEVIVRYKDTVTAYGGVKRARFDGIGALSNRISAYLSGVLAENGIRGSFISLVNDREQLRRKVEKVPVEIVVHNVVAGSLARRLGVEEGVKPGNVIVEFRYCKGELGDPLINEDHVVALGLMSYEELSRADALARKANEVLVNLFHCVGIALVDFKLSFGRAPDGSVVLCDDLNPGRCRLWDEKTCERLDKDSFRHDLGNVLKRYRTVLDRLTANK